MKFLSTIWKLEESRLAPTDWEKRNAIQFSYTQVRQIMFCTCQGKNTYIWGYARILRHITQIPICQDSRKGSNEITNVPEQMERKQL